MGSLTIWHWLIVLAIVILAFGTKRLTGVDGESSRSVLKGEFIRDRLPKRFPAALVLVIVFVFCAVAWWLTR